MSIAVALTCGEPAGIGPEIAALAWDELREALPFFLIGDPAHLPPGTPIEVIADPSQAAQAARTGLPVLRHDFVGSRVPGRTSPAHAPDVVAVIARAVGLVQTGRALALCTAPIHKQALQDGAGFAFPGHTEYLAHLAGVPRVVMMLASAELRVVPTTVHIPLADVPGALSSDLLEDTIRITHAALVHDFDVTSPRLAVAGLNPHAGEGGKMGREEIELIDAVLVRLRAEGLNLRGPMSADTMFHPAARATYDAAICMYHDQALIPIKTLDFDRGVNVTLGLPFIRTSPDHGTALDIAGQGRASPTSLIEALKMAHRLGLARAR